MKGIFKLALLLGVLWAAGVQCLNLNPGGPGPVPLCPDPSCDIG